MRLLRIIIVVAGLLLLLSVVGTIYLASNLDKHKGILEDSASKALGRTVEIQQGVTLNWSMTPSIALAGLQVGNPAWTGGEYLVQAERTVLVFNIRELFNRRLAVKQVRVQNADVFLESAVDGKQNWVFTNEAQKATELPIDNLSFQNTRVYYRAAEGPQHKLDIEQLELRSREEEAPVLSMNYKYQELAITASATLDQITPSYQLTDVQVEMLGDRLDVSGILGSALPNLPITAPLQQVKAVLETAGDSPVSLISNLSGTIEIGSAGLTLPLEKGVASRDISLKRTRLNLVPGKPVTLRTDLQIEKQPFQLELSGGTLAELFTGKKVWQQIKFNAHGKHENKALQVSGQLGTSSAIVAGRNLAVDLLIRHDDLEVRLGGKLARITTLEGSQLTIKAATPSLARLTPWLEMELPETDPFQLAAQLSGKQQRLHLKDIKAKIGTTDLAGEIKYALVQGGAVEIDLKSGPINLTPFFAKPTEQNDNSKEILAWEMSRNILPDINARLRFEMEGLKVAKLRFDDVILDATLDSGKINLAVSDKVNRLNVKLDLVPENSSWRLTLRNKSKLELGQLLDGEKDLTGRPVADVALDVDLSGRGRSLDAVLDSAQGHIGGVVSEGYLSEEASQYLLLGTVLSTLMDTLSKGKEVKTVSQLECAVLHFDVNNGIASSKKGLALRTDRVNVIGGGALKLSTGEIDLHFKTAQRKGLGIDILGVMDNFIRLTGTLRQPGVALNEKGFLLHGGAAWATGGLSLLYESLFTSLTAFSNPCETVLKTAGKEPKPATVPNLQDDD
jgi:uncharacterized protein involved in outer membrane biogenesis